MQIDIVCLPWDPGIEGVGSDQEKAPATPSRDPQHTAHTRQHVEAVHRTAASQRMTHLRPTLRHLTSGLRGFPMSRDVHCPSRTDVRKHVACSICSAIEPRQCNDGSVCSKASTEFPTISTTEKSGDSA
ncbi:uncharacterized protein LOC119406985 [Rhipicephalus sanguineus]|uniref:uncharacterized protein LOC119406985 n=1 Tax=Rhipicephalus sanguineus TaxID=34632 RepID=UPI001893F4FD|nr:uncharacterized protein LOC119406985 [Rhipicephalus sanguineus]